MAPYKTKKHRNVSKKTKTHKAKKAHKAKKTHKRKHKKIHGGFGKPGMPVGKPWNVGTLGRNHYSLSKFGRPNGFIDPPISTRGVSTHVGGYKYRRHSKKTRKNKTRSYRRK